MKILSNVPRDSYFAIADEAAKQNISFVGHVPYAISVREAAAAGQKSIEHLTGFMLACSSREDELRGQELTALANHDYAAYQKLGTEVMATYDQSKAHALFLQIAQGNTWQVPTLVWTQANSRIDDSSLGVRSALEVCSVFGPKRVGSREAAAIGFSGRTGQS